MITSNINLQHEYINCALCGIDSTDILYQINTQKCKLSSLWIDDICYDIASIETIVKCKTCGLIYVNPRRLVASNICPYSPIQELYYFQKTYPQRWRAYTRLVHLLPHWLGYHPQTLLDIGCGDGALIEVARIAGINSHGVEISPSLIRLVQARLGIDSVVSDLTCLPDKFYDVITIINVLEHTPEPIKVLQESKRLIKPGGMLLVHVPNIGGLPARLTRARWHQIEPLEHFYYFHEHTLNHMLMKVGLEPKRRFSLITSSGIKGTLQSLLNRSGIYLDNGLGILAYRQ